MNRRSSLVLKGEIRRPTVKNDEMPSKLHDNVSVRSRPRAVITFDNNGIVSPADFVFDLALAMALARALANKFLIFVRAVVASVSS